MLDQFLVIYVLLMKHAEYEPDDDILVVDILMREHEVV